MINLRSVLASVAFALAAATAFTQGTQTGTISGTVTSSDGQPLPGTIVSVKSRALIGTRSTTSDANGAYILKGLPPGAYTVTFQMSGLATVERKEAVASGVSTRADARMQMAGIEETVVVTSDVQNALGTATGGAQYASEDIDHLANSRTLFGITEVAPGLTDKTPNAGQVTISGSFGYDNVFLIDGVDVNDNLFGTPDDLFIEDAIDEVQVLTSGISAEYGRFSGGVINALTKRGGNTLSGSFRTDFSNPKWLDETPFENENGTVHEDVLGKVYQATLGGPVVKDRLWFFAAGRRERSATPNVFDETGDAYTQRDDNDREELKLTGNVNPNHTLQGTYLRNHTNVHSRAAFPFSIDPRTLYDEEQPNSLVVLNYNGVLRSNLFAEAQVSQKKFGFRGAGGVSRERQDSPFISTQTGDVLHYNAPYFDATDPEDRNNRQFTASLSYFLSTSSLGKHDLKAGVEHFTSRLRGGNSQSSTDYVFFADYATDAAGKPLRDAQNRLIPVFDAANPATTLRNWLAVRGATVDLRTVSVYVNDRWALSPRWSFNLGLRYETVASEATGGLKPIDVGAVIVPRLALSFDPRGDGQWRLDATYGQYAGRYSESQFASNTNVGNPDLLVLDYVGPTGRGIDFAPGLDPRNYRLIGGSFPTANISIDPDLRSPLTHEITLAVSRQVAKGFVKALYTRRHTTHFVEDFTTFDEGQTTVRRDGNDFGTFDNVVFRNTNEPRREYQAVQLIGRVSLTSRWDLRAHWTYQIRNHGTFEGEDVNVPQTSSTFGDFPEYRSPERHYPFGRLAQFQRSKIFAETTYTQHLGRAGELTGGLTWRYESPLTFSDVVANVPVTAQQIARDPGYALPPEDQTIFFGARGANQYAAYHVFHFALTYGVPVWRTARPWLKFEVRNLLNNDKLISWDHTIDVASGSPVDSLGLPTTFVKGARYGTATSNSDYPVARKFLFSVGLRF
jgi:outer membrane receptor for ferrienterochelin and colicin